MVTQNCTHEEIKNRLNLGNACCQSTHFCLPTCYKKKKRKVKYFRLHFSLLFCMGMKLDARKNID